MYLMRLDGLRPMGISTDNLHQDFPMLVSCLEAKVGIGLRLDALSRASSVLVLALARILHRNFGKNARRSF